MQKLTPQELRSAAHKVGLVESCDGRTMRSVGQAVGLTVSDALAWAAEIEILVRARYADVCRQSGNLASIAGGTDVLSAGVPNRPPAFESHFRNECGMPDHAEFQWDAPYMVAALDGWNSHARHSLATDVDGRRESVARVICAACDESPAEQGDAQGSG